jgi:hypothetical protein
MNQAYQAHVTCEPCQQTFVSSASFGIAIERFRRHDCVRVPDPLANCKPVDPAEIVARMSTARGGWTKATLEEWGVPWPPPKGWRETCERLFARRPTRP